MEPKTSENGFKDDKSVNPLNPCSYAAIWKHFSLPDSRHANSERVKNHDEFDDDRQTRPYKPVFDFSTTLPFWAFTGFLRVQIWGVKWFINHDMFDDDPQTRQLF